MQPSAMKVPSHLLFVSVAMSHVEIGMLMNGHSAQEAVEVDFSLEVLPVMGMLV
jgi:hypothetical protein